MIPTPDQARLARLAVFLAVFAACAATTRPGEAAQDDIHFAEPYSGKKVTSYELTLPVSRTERRSFLIPSECTLAQSLFDEGAHQWCTRVERSLWWKVRRDCHFYTFLHRFDGPPVEDYVSNYDFMNAQLSDLPMGARCDPLTAFPGDPNCRPFPLGIPDLSRLLAFQDRGTEAARAKAAPCQLKDGIYRGRVVRDASGIHCEPDPDAPGFRVLSVHYADVNGDGFQDVVLRLVPLGPGAGRAPFILPLTRLGPDSAFIIPEIAVVPAPN
jgi:hypothetical protein